MDGSMGSSRSRVVLQRLSLVALGLASVIVTPSTTAQSSPLLFESVSNALTRERLGSTGSSWYDVDGDGRPEVAIPARDSSPNTVHVNESSGFRPIPIAAASGPISHSAAWGDIDGDGDADLLFGAEGVVAYVTEMDAGGISLHRSADAGILTSESAPRAQIEALSLGDVDRDGDLDVAAAGFGTAGTFLFLNDGTGRFVLNERDDFPYRSWLGGLHLVDFDRDGSLDMLATGGALPSHRFGSFLYWNERKGWRPDVAQALSRHGDGLGSSVGDVDGDGDLDIFVAGWRAASASGLYINEGKGIFNRRGHGFIPRIVGSALADIDADGDLDLLTSSGYSDVGAVQFWQNDGRGNLARVDVAGLTSVPGRYGGLTVIDFDADGRLDIFVASRSEPSKLFRNVSSIPGQLAIELSAARASVPTWGATVECSVRLASGSRSTLHRTVHQQTGYASHSEPVAYCAPGRAGTLTGVRIRWSDGREQVLAPSRDRQRMRVTAPARQ
jgi:hypothetical protein